MRSSHTPARRARALRRLTSATLLVFALWSSAVPAFATEGTEADVTVSKTVSDDLVGPGATVTYSLSVTNNGPDAATGVVLTDTLPPGVTPTGQMAPNCAAGADPQQVVCVVGDLPAGTTAGPMAYDATMPTELGVYTNSVVATADNEIDPTNNEDEVNVEVESPESSVSVSKTADVTHVAPGGTIVYTITVTNAGPGSASDVVVTDQLPAGTTFVDDGDDDCDTSGLPTVTCTIPLLRSGAAKTFEITVTAPGETGEITNSVTVSASNDTNPDDNSAEVLVHVEQPSADLLVHKSATSDTVGVGMPLSYTVSAVNQGPFAAQDVTVVDTLPAGVTFDGSTPGSPDCNLAGSTLTCALGDLAPTGIASVTIDVMAPPEEGEFTNTATVSAASPADPNPDDNTGSATVTAVDGGDLFIHKSDSKDPVATGERFTYDLMVTNNGPGTVEPVTVIDVLPAGVNFAGASDPSCVEDPEQVVTCSIDSLGPADTTTITLSVDAPSETGMIENLARVASPKDTNAQNNETTEQTTVLQPGADLVLTKDASADIVAGGSEIVYTITVTNDGPDDATNTVVTDTLPEGLTFIEATTDAPGGECQFTDPTVTCTLGSLGALQGAHVTIRVRVPMTLGTFSNQASASSDTTDPDPGDNSDGADVEVSDRADLSVHKFSSPDPADPSDQSSYIISIHNMGPVAATNVVLTDALPDGIQYFSDDGDDPIDPVDPDECDHAGGVLTCTIERIEPGGFFVVTVIVLTPAEDGVYRNTATATADTTDPDLTNNSDTDSLIVGDPALADLSLSGHWFPSPVSATEPSTYFLQLSNNGPEPALGVEVRTELPAGLAFSSAGPGCANTDGTVVCAVGDMDPFGFTGLEIVAVPATEGLFSPEAMATAASPEDPDLDNNATAPELEVLPAGSADLSLFASAGGSPSVGRPFPYYLTLVNFGPSTGTGAQLLYNLPTDTTLDFARVDGGVCSESGGLVTCEVPDLEPHGGVGALISIFPGAAGDLSSTFRIRGGPESPDPDLENNETTVKSESLPEGSADLGVQLSSFGPAAGGTPFDFVAYAFNGGPSPSIDAVVRITLPAGWTLGFARWFGGECAIDGQTFVCAIGEIGVYSYEYIEVRATPPAGGGAKAAGARPAVVEEPASRAITATIDGAGPDAVEDNDTDELDVTVYEAGAADLHLAKGGPSQAAAGEPFFYSIGVFSTGPATAENVVVTDELDPNLEILGTPITTRGACEVAGQTVTCTVPSLDPYDYFEIQIKVRALAVGQVDNTATVALDGDDPSQDDNSASHELEVLAAGAADLAIFKVGDWGGAAGAPFTYEVHVANHGPGTASNVTITDDLPEGMAFQSATASQGSCTETEGRVECVIPTLAPHESAYAGITVIPDAPGDVTNTATVTTPEGDDPNEGNNTSEYATTIFGPGSADLSISKSVSGFGAVGQDVAFLIDVFNHGPSPAGKVVVTDPLPAGLTFVGASASQGVCSFDALTRTVECRLGTVGLFRAARVRIVVEPQQDGSTENTATVAHEADDPQPDNDEAMAALEVAPDGATDVAISKEGFNVAVAGANYTYTIGVWNNGWSGAQDVEVTDPLPASLQFVSGVMTSTGTPCTEDLGTVTCLVGDMGPFASEQIDLTVVPLEVGEVENTATVTTGSPDVNEDNNEDDKEINVVPQGTADLAISKSGWWPFAAAGEEYAFWINVQNNGPSAAPDVVVTDSVPGTMTIVHVSPSTGTCEIVAQDVTCSLGTIEAYGGGFVEIRVVPTAAGTYRNTARLTSGANDDEADNDEDEFELEVFEPGTADLEIDKTDSVDPAAAGQPFQYVLTAANNGPDVAHETEIVDTLPEGVSFGSAEASQGSCAHDPATRKVTCALGDVHPFGYVTVVITVTAGAEGTFLDTALISHDGPDPDTEDNTDAEETTVVPDIAGDPEAQGGQVETDEETGEVTVSMRRAEIEPIMLAIPAVCPDGSVPDAVTLTLGTFSIEMTLGEDGLYHATIPVEEILSGDIVVTVLCGDDPVSNDVGQIQLYDPSGIVTDAKSGAVVEGATVLLHNVPGWRARTGPADTGADTCESNASKVEGADWSQSAPVEIGVLASPFTGTIDPAVNPLVTDASGKYGWDVAAGCWYVTVAKPGYALRVSPVVGVPPAVTDLDLTLEPLTISIGAPASVVYGKPIALSGTVAAPAACKSRTLKIQRDVVGGATTFETVTTTTSNATTGKWAKTIAATGKAGQSSTWRVVSDETPLCGAVTSAKTVRVNVAKAVTLKSSATGVKSGKTVTLTAAVTPCAGHAGQTVTLQKRSGTRFVNVKTVKTNSKCAAAFVVTITATTVFRVLAIAHTDHPLGTSNLVTVRRL